jgi:hypothetical protein
MGYCVMPSIYGLRLVYRCSLLLKDIASLLMMFAMAGVPTILFPLAANT